MSKRRALVRSNSHPAAPGLAAIPCQMVAHPDWQTMAIPDGLGTPSSEWVQCYRRRVDGLAVIRTASLRRNERLKRTERWLHVSASLSDRIPSWEDMVEVKRVFVGSHRLAIQVHPAEADHVNIMPYCLHLWSPMDGSYLPDFAIEGLV